MRVRHLRPICALLLASAAGCGGGGGSRGGGGAPPPATNTAPVVIAPPAERTGDFVDGPIEVDLRPSVDDAEDGSNLAFAIASVSPGHVLAASVGANTGVLVADPLDLGTAEVRVRATDSGGLWVELGVTLTFEGTRLSLRLAAQADATIYGGGSAANGSGQHLFVGTNAGAVPTARRALLRFDLTGLPAPAVVVGARVEVRVSRTPSASGSSSVALHPLTTAWTEGPTDPGGNEGGGAPAVAGDVTWSATGIGSATWSSEGGDFVAAASATTVLTDSGEVQAWSGSGLAADVEAWRMGTPNHGWIAIGPEGTAQSVRRLESRQAAIAEDGPSLVLELIGR